MTRIIRSSACLRCFSMKLARCFSTSFGASYVGRDAPTPNLPVLIVGAGPVGLVLSLLLTKLGIRCAILEKSTVFPQHPQAHFINNRSMEAISCPCLSHIFLLENIHKNASISILFAHKFLQLFRKLDGLAEEIQRLQPPVDLWRKFIYCTSLSGSILGSVDHMEPQDADKISSPVSVTHFSQYKLVRLLLQKVENLGFNVCTSESIEASDQYKQWERKILMGHECISINPTSQGVDVGISFFKNGKVEERKLKCSLLVGADGARSTVRKLMDIEMKGERDLQQLVSVHFLSRDLGKYLMQHRSGMLFFIFSPEAIGVLVAHDLNQGEFVLQVPYYPPQQKIEDFSSEVCEQIIFKLAGQELEDLQVVDIKPWVMHAEVAEKFVTGDNRVILVGDAAHRFPPAGGFGMNTGIQDAHNLAWKISSLLNGVSAPYIIQTYETERKPIAMSNTALSVQNFKAAMAVPAALGLDPTIANSVHRAINSSFGSVLPASFQKAMLEGMFSLGRAQLLPFFLNEDNPIGSVRLANLKRIFDEGKSLQLQFPAEDLGFRYMEGALVADGIDISRDTEKVSSNGRKELRDFVASVRSGSRLPHMQVRALKYPTKEALSTLDLIPGDKLEFLLIIAPTEASFNLARTASRAADSFHVSLKVCVIWPRGTLDKHGCDSGKALDPCKSYIEVEEVRSSSSKSWWDICNLTRKGVILVRPDEHIAWRAEVDAVTDIAQEVEMVFSTILGVQRSSA